MRVFDLQGASFLLSGFCVRNSDSRSYGVVMLTACVKMTALYDIAGNEVEARLYLPAIGLWG